MMWDKKAAGSVGAPNRLVLTVRNCRGLRAFNFFQKLSVYAVISIRTDEKSQVNPQQQRTPRDKEDGGGNPEWDHEMRFDLSEASLDKIGYDRLFLAFDLRSEGLFGGKSIGEVRVPLSELISDCTGIVRFVSYEIRNSDGKPNGVLNFSFRVELKGGNHPTVYPDDLHPKISASHPSSRPHQNRFDDPPQSIDPAIRPSPMDLLIPSTTHEPSPIHHLSYPPPVEQQTCPSKERLYPPIPPQNLDPLHPLLPHPNCSPLHPIPRPLDPYGYTVENRWYGHSHEIYGSHPCQGTAVERRGFF